MAVQFGPIPYSPISVRDRLKNGTLLFALAGAAVLLLKLVCLAVFSSGIERALFVPFVEHYLNHFGNPWATYPPTTGDSPFPYPPLMLYILSVCYAPFYYFSQELPGWLVHFGFRLPILLADVAIFGLLLKFFPKSRLNILLLYGIAPIVIYSSYMHGQLDLIPMAFMMGAVYTLKKFRFNTSALLFGLGLAAKMQLLAAFPLILIYLYKTKRWQPTLRYVGIALGVYLFLTLPYLWAPQFIHLVLMNNKQQSFFNNVLYVHSIPLYTNLLIFSLIYLRFLTYRKVNFDLFESFLFITFALFVLLIEPSPGWYVWLMPFFVLFVLKSLDRHPKLIWPYVMLNIFYYVFFAYCQIMPYPDVLYHGYPLFAKLNNHTATGVVFTLLEATLIGALALSYRYGIRSNSIYKLKRSLVMGIGGDSASGKTTLLKDLETLLGNKILSLEGDGDHKWERGDMNWKKYTHLNPKANNLHRQADNILALREGMPVYWMEYNHKNGTFQRTNRLKPKDFVVLCGLHPFYLPKMRKMMDLKIYLDPDPELKFHWKVLRDSQSRGYTVEQVRSQIETRTEDMEKYIAPQRAHSDLVASMFILDHKQLKEGVSPAVNDLGLSVQVDSSLPLEELLNRLLAENVQVDWDYSSNLATQSMKVYQTVSAEKMTQWLYELLPNLEEIMEGPVSLEEGHRGFLQLIVLILIDYTLRHLES